jgi:hypothetical protein
VQVKDRHVVAAAMAVQVDAIVTFNIADFAAAHSSSDWVCQECALVYLGSGLASAASD